MICAIQNRENSRLDIFSIMQYNACFEKNPTPQKPHKSMNCVWNIFSNSPQNETVQKLVGELFASCKRLQVTPPPWGVGQAGFGQPRCVRDTLGTWLLDALRARQAGRTAPAREVMGKLQYCLQFRPQGDEGGGGCPGERVLFFEGRDLSRWWCSGVGLKLQLIPTPSAVDGQTTPLWCFSSFYCQNSTVHDIDFFPFCL